MAGERKKRIPQLRHTDLRGIGWHVSYRDADTGTPRKHRFGMIPKAEAELAYHRWLAAHLSGEPQSAEAPTPARRERPRSPGFKPTRGSILEIATSLLDQEEARTRSDPDDRRRGSIGPRVLHDRKKHVRDYLEFLNERHGHGAVASISLHDLTMDDVEAYNRRLVDADYSASQVAKRMRIVKAIIDRGGRPEHGRQLLPWNWESRDIAHGVRTAGRSLPSKPQLERLLAATDLRGRTLIWMAIGLGFGQGDLSAIRVNQIDAESYDLRRGKTGIERYGSTPPLVWSLVQEYLQETPRGPDELLFVTRRGLPLVHERSDAIQQWWHRLRNEIGESKETLDGFYVLRHLGATEFGSRPGCSIGDMRRWLGHSATSRMADVYMKPVSPEDREVVSWIAERLGAGTS